MSRDANRFYAVLGVDPDTSDEAIRAAFRRRAKELHPDSPHGDADAFILLKRAYDTLGDPARRAEYDRPEPPPPHRWATPAPPPATPWKPPPQRRRSTGRLRAAVAFTVMAAISLGAVEAMISLTSGPPSIRTRESAPAAAATASAEATPKAETASTPEPHAAPGSSKTGFWDPEAGSSKKP